MGQKWSETDVLERKQTIRQFLETFYSPIENKEEKERYKKERKKERERGKEREKVCMCERERT